VPDRPVYLDNHATTRTDPRVVEAMLPFFTMAYGNPSSAGHRFGWEAAEAVERAREQVATLIGAEPREIVFTSGATEANNLALKGVLPALTSRGNHVVTSAVEHRSVLDPLKRLGRTGWELTVVAPDRHGAVTPAALAAALTDRTVLVSLIAASNEVGTIHDLAALGRLCRERRAVFHTDAVQAVGKVPVDVANCAVDLLSLSGHKLYGPKGIGALYVRRGGDPAVRLTPLLDGGGQERGLRSGTVPVPLVVGLGAACAIAARERDAEAARLATLRARLQAGITGCIDGVRRNGHPERCLAGNLSLSFAGVDGEALMMAMREVAVSSGAACTSGQPEPSHVLRAMGLDEQAARASLRFGLGRFTTEDEVDFAAAYVVAAVRRLRGDSSTVPPRAGEGTGV
jgi:cysteine desulfurase